ncbi:MAG: glycerophosphodiester phosphodiesterase family protein, partial [Vicinamibacterales bacterium]
MLSPRILIVVLLGLRLVSASIPAPNPNRTRTLIAHRGASAYAPEHTMQSYELAISQGADFVEPDLAVSKDGQLVCLHDDTLERTTDVEEVFPDRFNETVGRRTRAWLANDFTVEEMKSLDAGSWFDSKYAGARMPTWDEMLRLVGDHPGVGVYPELKSPPLYSARGV